MLNQIERGPPSAYGTPHQARETKEALNAVCVTASGANLHSPTNSTHLNPIEHVWWMGKRSISREQCNTPEELPVQAQAALAAITMESVNGIAESYSTRLCAVLVLIGQCLHGRPDLMRNLQRGIQTPKGNVKSYSLSRDSSKGTASHSLLSRRAISLGALASRSPSDFPCTI
jgi:hypothetical protein